MSTLYLPISIAHNTELSAVQSKTLKTRRMLPASSWIEKKCWSVARAQLSILFLFKEYRVCLDPDANPRAQEWLVTKEEVCRRRFGILFPGFPISPILQPPALLALSSRQLPALPVLLALFYSASYFTTDNIRVMYSAMQLNA